MKTDCKAADRLHARACQIADSYIKDNWGSMAFENLRYDTSLYQRWLSVHDAAIYIFEKESM